MPGPTVDDIVALIQGHRFSLSDEKRMQNELQEVLKDCGIPFEREKRLSPGDILDFLVAGGIAIECKIRGRGAQKKSVYRQLKRYAEHAEVTSVILASNLSMGLPSEIEGKPAAMASLSTGWL